jgi:hypothetical protein
LSEDLTATGLSPYLFWMVDKARQPHQAGALERTAAAVLRSRVSLLREFVSAMLRWSAFRRVAGRAVPRADRRLSRELIRDLDRWAACHLGEPSVVNGLSGFATETLSQASVWGVTVLGMFAARLRGLSGESESASKCRPGAPTERRAASLRRSAEYGIAATAYGIETAVAAVLDR